MGLPPDHRFYHAPNCVNNPKEPAMTQPAATAAITKDQASDLKSHIDRLRECDKKLLIAQQEQIKATCNLDQFVYDLQHPKQGA